METFKHNCATCAVREACEFTFGKYFPQKSGGGVGCKYPVGDEAWAAKVMAVAARVRAEESAAASAAAATEPPPAAEGTWRKYAVLHLGRIHKTTAKSEAGAINFVRFKLYGTRPLSDCPPFSASVVAADETGKMTKADALARLRRMTA